MGNTGLTRRQWLAGMGAAAMAWFARPLFGAQAAKQEVKMILIPGGIFLMGTTPEQAEALARQYGCHVSWLGGECPQRKVDLPPFLIDRYPVTNRDYAAFCQATGHRPAPHWEGNEPPARLLDHPVTFVNRADARAFAKWAGKRLPDKAEWEKAARGTDGRLFPWGDAFDPKACQHDLGGIEPPIGTAAVTSFPKGASPFGVMDMAGNVAEWCDDGPGPHSAYLKGGCWHTSSPVNLRCAAHSLSGFDDNTLPYIGFRCAKEI